MSDAALPPDPADWPDDPFALLGVRPGVAPRDLKRAYTRLIRRYKPEQSPEEFRRIRSAYETVLRLTEFLGPQSPAGPAPPPEPLPPPQAVDPADDPDALWERAAAGDAAGAYAALRDLERRRPEWADLPLRLYWLLALDPELDPGTPASAWLVRALERGGLGGPAAGLFSRELDERPEEALRAGADLLDADAPPPRLVDCAAARWRAALRLRRWDVVRDDLERLRERVRPADEDAWLRAQFAAADVLAWHADDPAAAELLAACRREVEAHSHLSVRHAEAFDRLDFLLSAAAGWPALRRGGRVPAEFLDLLPLAWTRPFAAVRGRLVAVLDQIARQPREWLGHFDAVAERSAAALAQFGGLLAQYQDRLDGPLPEPLAPQHLVVLVAEFFANAGPMEYRLLRPRLLAFCLHEAVGPEHVAPMVPPLTDRLLADWPLRSVCWAVRLFGA